MKGWMYLFVAIVALCSFAIASAPAEAEAGPVLRVLTWPVVAPIRAVVRHRRCHSHRAAHQHASCHGPEQGSGCHGH